MLKKKNDLLLITAYVILFLFFGTIAVGMIPVIGLLKSLTMVIVNIGVVWSVVYTITH